ncbi:helix-turn-helix domain-containing protein [Ensifer sp. PDNC004]|uniref:helix-turn-helix domain-containing protein n=1 Tax=Ensifer sp. PDNC004 TaxID=2811423 RepID=UPI001FEED0B0|nr:helix-turn-helix transcriptional regulator [Ensifer sp. PDNC004]
MNCWIAARKSAGIIQVELGKLIGQRQTFVSKYELGERRLDVAEYVRICRALKADPHAFIDEAEASSRRTDDL